MNNKSQISRMRRSHRLGVGALDGARDGCAVEGVLEGDRDGVLEGAEVVASP